jgi:YidC/Oxa1 family membrane protein insertase
LELLLGTNILLDPIVAFLEVVLKSLNGFTHNFGWSLIVLALLVKAVFWPLNTFQFKSISKMQALQPKIKALQAKYKNDKERLQQEQMALFKEHGANPFASCLPLLLQMPILYSLYYAIISNRADFGKTSWAWIGSPVSHAMPKILALSLAQPDYLLLALYVVSMYFSVRFSSPAMDEQQAQQQKIMALVSPVMIAFIGRFWPSALILYWLTFNVLTMAQQMYLMRRFSMGAPAAGAVAATGAAQLAASPAQGASAETKGLARAGAAAAGSQRSQRRKKGSRR